MPVPKLIRRVQRPLELLAAALLTLAWGSPALACSFRGVWGSFDPRDLHVMVRALPDTAVAGPGTIVPTNAPGHYGRGGRIGIVGQVMAIEELPPLTAAALPSGTTRAVFVPWDYGPDCSPVAWGGSARWVEPSRAVLITARLRAREHWAGDLPTFDVRVPHMAIYDPRKPALNGDDSIAATALEPRRVMHLIDSLRPRSGTLDTVAARAIVHRLLEDPALRDRYPVPGLIAEAASVVHTAREQGVRPPFVGTLRLEFSFNGGPWRTLWARTDPSPMSWFLHDYTRLEGVPRHPLDPRPYDGYELYLHTGEGAAVLPRSCEELQVSDSGYGYVAVPVHAPGADRAAGRWRVHFENSLIFGAFTREDSMRTDSLFPPASPLDRVPGLTPRFEPEPMAFDIDVRRRRRHGLARFDGVLQRKPFGQVRIRGTQVDTVAVACAR